MKKGIGEERGHLIPGVHERLMSERHARVRDMLAQLDQLQSEVSHQAGQLLWIDAVLFASLILLIITNPLSGSVVAPIERIGQSLGIGLSALILAISLVFSALAASGQGLLAGIFSPQGPGPDGLYFDNAEASALQTRQDFLSIYQLMSDDEITTEILRTITIQRKSLARQARAVQRGRFFLLLALVPWLVALAFRLISFLH